MKVIISETERYQAFRLALINLSRFFNIPNCDYEDNQTLYNNLKELNYPIFYFLKEYFAAYNKWYEFYQKQKNDNFKKEYDIPLDNWEKTELNVLIQNKQNTREALQKEFDKLQFDKFKKLHGLEDVMGLDL